MNQQLVNGLVDGLLDMIDGSRLQEEDIPDDFQWLTETLNTIAASRAAGYTSESEYVRNGGCKCLVCGEGSIEGGSVEIDGAIAWQAVHCTECESSWNDVYRLVSVSDVQEDEEASGTCKQNGIKRQTSEVEPSRGLESLLNRG